MRNHNAIKFVIDENRFLRNLVIEQQETINALMNELTNRDGFGDSDDDSETEESDINNDTTCECGTCELHGRCSNEKTKHIPEDYEELIKIIRKFIL